MEHPKSVCQPGKVQVRRLSLVPVGHPFKSPDPHHPPDRREAVAAVMGWEDIGRLAALLCLRQDRGVRAVRGQPGDKRNVAPGIRGANAQRAAAFQHPPGFGKEILRLGKVLDDVIGQDQAGAAIGQRPAAVPGGGTRPGRGLPPPPRRHPANHPPGPALENPQVPAGADWILSIGPPPAAKVDDGQIGLQQGRDPRIKGNRPVDIRCTHRNGFRDKSPGCSSSYYFHRGWLDVPWAFTARPNPLTRPAAGYPSDRFAPSSPIHFGTVDTGWINHLSTRTIYRTGSGSRCAFSSAW